MSALLLDDRLLCYQPALVRRLGLAEAAIVQQLHYWAPHANNSHDGHVWVYKTYEDWSAEIGISAKAVRGALDRLRRDGVVVGIQSPVDNRDRTLWWRIDHDVLNANGSPEPPGSRSAPEGSPTALTGSSHARVPDAVQRVRAETTKERKNARADRKMQIPDGFPDELRPHAREVMRILRAVAADHPMAKAVYPREVGLAIMAYPRRPLVETAHALAGWAVDPKRPIKDVASTYRTFLKRERDLASVERLATDGTPTTDGAGIEGNVRRIWPQGQRLSNADQVEAQIMELRGEA
jgi:DNA-binding Lrp family transcriptional regulator